MPHRHCAATSRLATVGARSIRQEAAGLRCHGGPQQKLRSVARAVEHRGLAPCSSPLPAMALWLAARTSAGSTSPVSASSSCCIALLKGWVDCCRRAAREVGEHVGWEEVRLGQGMRPQRWRDRSQLDPSYLDLLQRCRRLFGRAAGQPQLLQLHRRRRRRCRRWRQAARRLLRIAREHRARCSPQLTDQHGGRVDGAQAREALVGERLGPCRCAQTSRSNTAAVCVLKSQSHMLVDSSEL